MLIKQEEAKTRHDPKLKMSVMPIYGKTIQTTSSPEHWADLATKCA